MINEHLQLIHKCCEETRISINEFIDDKGELTLLGSFLLTSVALSLCLEIVKICNEKNK